MEAPWSELRVPDLPLQAIRAFRTMAEAELAIPRMAARKVASRIEVPRHLVFRRWIQRIINCDSKKIEALNCGEE